MKLDMPLLNQPSKARLLGVEWMRFEAKQILQNQLRLAQMVRVLELRKSCGVESENHATVNVRLPPRYL